MAVVLPFRGLRFNTRQALDLALVTAPPYDCISPHQQQDLYEAHPYNIVRIILGMDYPEDDDKNNRYTRAARFLKEWIDTEVLTRERRPALYLYEQEFSANGRTCVRRGFTGRVQLEEFGTGSVVPHEKTLSAPKEDRLKLLRATRCNLSQIMALYVDDRNEVMGVFDRLPLASPDLQVVDDNGVINRMWIVTDEAAAAEVTELMRRRPLYIADGHHRYTTALNYRDYLRSTGEDVSGRHAANFTTATCISMNDPGLVIMPTHRVLPDFPRVAAEAVHHALRDHFAWRKFTGMEATSNRMEEHMAKSRAITFGIYVHGDQAGYLATLKDPNVMKSIVPQHSEDWRRLDVAVLHQFVFDRLLAEASKEGGNFAIRYVHLAADAFDAVHENGASLAFLVRPTRLEQLRAIAGAGELMPQKSTYFYPKLLSGLILNPLD